ncbi:flagellar biosynthesis protein [Clostridium cavendishii DSM 21758]|uniref:Flagellar biosynthesis protein n=1 Tax=Clostridium cavendishii DSM 21758 TaxID=1121302 RepID=A0A1M6Q4F7_9CLOT|nr:EscU/YscU/HrcU family type III secretion system export apparatus switch protein [Clostridium cavendishii]SHK14993.1 flagellar biosynthesis protein [Clostridium cavendishii DSM 21758]
MNQKQTRKAAALKYEQNFEAPIVSAAGMGLIADNILKKAEEADVPVVYNKELADMLCNMEVGEAIPTELYEAVAHIIAYVTDIDNLMKVR